MEGYSQVTNRKKLVKGRLITENRILHKRSLYHAREDETPTIQAGGGVDGLYIWAAVNLLVVNMGLL